MKLFLILNLLFIVLCEQSLRKKKGPTIVHTPVILGYT